jgi:hypothetical protein
VNLRDGKYAQTASMDFVHRGTLDPQLAQLLVKQRVGDGAKLFEFTNESGELLAFRASAYGSHTITAVDRRP